MSLERQFPDHILSPGLARRASDSAVGRPLIGATWVDEYPRVCVSDTHEQEDGLDTWRQGTPQAGQGLPPAPLSHPPASTPTVNHLHTHTHTQTFTCPLLSPFWKQHHVPDAESVVTTDVSRPPPPSQKGCVCVHVQMNC